MPLRPFHFSFNGGEVSPRFDGRADHQRYFSSLKTCLNFIPSAVGGVDRRPGTRVLAQQKDESRKARLMPFEFNTEQAYVLEMGHGYIRFFSQGLPVEISPGVPVEIASPYQDHQLFDLQTVQSADVMWIVHPAHPPAKLLRFSQTSWALQTIAFDPPPTAEVPTIGSATLTLGALSGAGVTVTASAAVFLDGDVGRQLTLVPSGGGGLARATITALNSQAPTNSLTINITAPFPAATLPPGSWQLDGPMGVGLQLTALGPESLKGTFVKGHLRQRGVVAPELVTNGSFAGSLSGWTDHSGITLASGNHTGGSGSNLQDTSKHFPALGVRVGMRAINQSSGVSGTISAITPDGRSLAVGATFNGGDAYRIVGSGGAQPANSGGQLSGGNAGTGWIEQAIGTIPGHSYRLTFDVYENPLSVQVGSFPTGGNLFAEASFTIGLQREVIFTALTGASYLQFRNNQPTMSRVAGVSCQHMSATGWRASEQGSFVKAFNGIFEVLGFDDTYTATLVIRTAPTGDLSQDAIAGAWTLEAPAWSAARGYPRAISFHQQRLGFAGTASQPLTIWQSETGNYEQFGASALADSSLEQEFSANEMNVLLWAEPFRDLLVGTAKGEHVLRGVNGPLTPGNGEQLPQTKVGSEPGLPPVRVDNALILFLRGGRQVRELEYDQNGAVVRGKDHTLIAEHITESGLVQCAFQSKPTAILWAVRTDGTLIGLTYEQFEQVQGWHRHTTQGAYESVCVVPVAAPDTSQTEDVYVTVQRFIDGQFRRFIEVFDATTTLDCVVRSTGAVRQVITGVGHLEGETVAVIDKSQGDLQPTVLLSRVVSGGAITVEIPVTVVDVGLTYPTLLQPLRPEVQLRDGTLQGRKKKWSTLTVRVLRTGGLLVNGHEALYRVPDDAMDEGLFLRSGDAEVRNLGWDQDGYVTISQIQPLPCTLIAIYGQLEVAED